MMDLQGPKITSVNDAPSKSIRQPAGVVILQVDTTGGFRAHKQRAKSTTGFSENLVFDQPAVEPAGRDRFFPGRFQSDVFDIGPFPEINKNRRALTLLFQKIAEIFI